mgnify:CR=1
MLSKIHHQDHHYKFKPNINPTLKICNLLLLLFNHLFAMNISNLLTIIIMIEYLSNDHFLLNLEHILF